MSDRKYQMSCSQPAVRWNDAFPSGNGTIGALVYGSIQHETTLLDHEDLWARTEEPDVPSISERLVNGGADVAGQTKLPNELSLTRL